jgi:hypothetical protein
MKRVLLVFPTLWDGRQLRNSEDDWQGRYEVHFAEPADGECPWDLDVDRWLDETASAWRGRLDGVLSTSDYPGATLAAALAARLGLPGPTPAAVLRCSHKFLSRLAQREAVPEAVPGFSVVDATRPLALAADLTWPCFAKPVKGAYSVHARRVDAPADLSAFLASAPVQEFVTHYLAIFDQLLARFSDTEVDGRHFIVEDLLRGRQVTVEGYATDEDVVVFGVVDSVMHTGTNSFARFDYPSALPADVTERMEDVTRRAIRGIGLRWSMFNAELVHDPETGRVSILEINPRLCGQFSDLYRKVDGTGGYFLALALACGETPTRLARGGRHAVAASRPLRIFTPSRVLRAPDEGALRAAERLYPGTLVWSECRTGDVLSDFARGEDGQSARYAVVNAGAEDPAALAARLERIERALGYAFEPYP